MFLAKAYMGGPPDIHFCTRSYAGPHRRTLLFEIPFSKKPSIKRNCAQAQVPRSSTRHAHLRSPCSLSIIAFSTVLSDYWAVECARAQVWTIKCTRTWLECTWCDRAHTLTWQHIIFVIYMTSSHFLKTCILDVPFRAETLCFSCLSL